MTTTDLYAAAQATLTDLSRPQPGDPFAGQRAVLGPALRVPRVRRERFLRWHFTETFRGGASFYVNAWMWATNGAYQRVLVALADSLCEDILEYDRTMHVLVQEQRERVGHSAAQASSTSKRGMTCSE